MWYLFMLQYIRHMLTTIAFLIHLLQGKEWFIGTGSCCIREQLHTSTTKRALHNSTTQRALHNSITERALHNSITERELFTIL